MTIPAAVRVGVNDALGQVGAGTVESIGPVSGGCISNTGHVRTSGGPDFFLKWSDALPAGIFRAEQASLRALVAAGGIRAPDVVASSDDDARPERWLLLEWLAPGRATPRTWTDFGNALAALHRSNAPAAGWPADNFIGSLPQPNAPATDWPDFWRLRRLEPQLRRARDARQLERADIARFDRLQNALDELIGVAAEDGMSLLHGDLWSGNVHVLESGEAALIDPACFHGHREVDLAMAELFGGFDQSFHAAYRDAWPLLPGYERERRAVYQLYFLLVHVNIFGGSYRAGTLAALRSLGF